jgi:hypothetical protein
MADTDERLDSLRADLKAKTGVELSREQMRVIAKLVSQKYDPQEVRITTL